MTPSRGTSYYVEPGYIYFSRKAALLRTVVGSCVAVCLWDSQLKYGGMNHFLMPTVTERDRATPKYGNVAVGALVRIMEEAGCQRRDMVAQILGGGAPDAGDDAGLGAQNVASAREVLARKNIRVIAEDTGGNVGRKIVFDTGTGELAVLKVHRIREGDWYA